MKEELRRQKAAGGRRKAEISARSLRRLPISMLLSVLLAATGSLSQARAQIFVQESFSDLNLVIPDSDVSGLTDVRTIKGIDPNALITDVNVTLRLDGAGARNGDLYVSLVHESGFSVLLNRVGRRDGSARGYLDSGFSVALDDAASNGDVHVYRATLFGNHSTAIGSSLSSDWAGAFAPDGRNIDPDAVSNTDQRSATLSSLNGLPVNGQWQLFVADLGRGGVSRLSGWDLDIRATTDLDASPIGYDNATVRADGEPRTLAAPVTVQGALSVLGNSDQTFSGAISGTGAISKSGQGKLVLTGANTFSGGVTLDEGALTIGDDRSLGFGPLTLLGGAIESGGVSRRLSNPVRLGGDAAFIGTQQIEFTGSATLDGNRRLTIENTTVFAGDIAEGVAGSVLRKSGGGALVLQGANTFSGGIAIEEGKLVIGNDRALGTGRLEIRGGTIEASGGRMMANPLQLSGDVQLAGSITFQGLTTVDGPRSIAVGNHTTFSGAIQDGLSPAAITKAGSGILTLTGANTFSGGVALDDGVLMVNNTAGSATGTGPVTVGSRGALGGSGSISGPLTVQRGGRVGPGNSPGTLTTGNATWNSAAVYQWEINDATGTAGSDPGWDLWNVAGTLTLAATAGDPFVVQLLSRQLAPNSSSSGLIANFNPGISYAWTILDASEISGFAPGEIALDTSAFLNSLDGGSFSIRQTGNALEITFTAVPEPVETGIAFAGFALVFAAARRMRRQNGARLPSRRIARARLQRP